MEITHTPLSRNIDPMPFIPSEKETTIEELNTSVQEIFGVSIEDNIALIDYLEGATAYEKKVDA